MNKKLMTEEQVKHELGIVDFRTITKDKIMNFVSLMPKLDKELSIKIIEQFPNYASMATSMVNNLMDMCNNALESNKVTEKEAIEAYKYVLETIRVELKDEEFTAAEKEKFTKQMIEVADKISEINVKNKKWLENIIKYGSSTLAVALVVGAAILGVNQNQK
ncbi:MAG: hypothetical protein PHO63_01130 [Bacilli bacterium]|nr:hypothetical protein [Bacilli bacterium]MDD4808458.1 hypothetical protein [Bacilli bacterium]